MLNLIFYFQVQVLGRPYHSNFSMYHFLLLQKAQVVNLTYFIPSSDYYAGGFGFKRNQSPLKRQVSVEESLSLVVVAWRWGCSSPTIIITLLIPLVRQVGSKIYKAHVVDFQTQHLRLIHHTVPQRVGETGRKLG